MRQTSLAYPPWHRENKVANAAPCSLMTRDGQSPGCGDVSLGVGRGVLCIRSPTLSLTDALLTPHHCYTRP
jgi:hypothetical protein